MKTTGLNTLFLGVAAAAMLGALATPAHATFIQTFNLGNTDGFDSIQATSTTPGVFVAPGFSNLPETGWTVATGSATLISAFKTTAGLDYNLSFAIKFVSDTVGLTFTFEALKGTETVDLATLTRTATGWNITQTKGNTITAPVPEPSTIIAGLLLLIPLGIGAVRLVRRTQTA